MLKASPVDTNIKHLKDDTLTGENMGIHTLLSLVQERTTDLSILFLEFEEIFAVAAGFVLVLMYLFYVRYSYDKEDTLDTP